MWIDRRKCEPMVDGTYLVQMTAGYLTGLDYTRDGGWNTHYTSDGELFTDARISSHRIARWFDAPQPPEVPDEWFEESCRNELEETNNGI